MTDTTGKNPTTAKPRDDRRIAPPSEPPIRPGEMTHMVLITIGTAVLTGILALPFTMPGKSFTERSTVIGASDFVLALE
ncbi:hypothetical protein [Pseudosulfitobacter koreensis]|uniref:Uncharacterized protein n=1 Tax=Pseudosulfitobacter koreensis TaxID=2968472 RepID=A0ABT1Z2H7_9RHOB|nr:hypothetical protein [Pseudosulfitobacter koreense]MCR8827320.1 hypothetical protein [Pseudosulfitobacter koreense]